MGEGEVTRTMTAYRAAGEGAAIKAIRNGEILAAFPETENESGQNLTPPAGEAASRRRAS